MFISEKYKLLLLQTRTPLTSALLLDGYIKEVVDFIISEKLSELVILTSSYSHEQHFIEKTPFEFLANKHFKEKNFPGFAEATGVSSIPGCGYAKLLHDQATVSSIPSVILYKFSSEGNNFYDGIQLCNNVNGYLKVIDGEIKTPVSWKNQFGCGVNVEIY
jgi:hypothetical protein